MNSVNAKIRLKTPSAVKKPFILHLLISFMLGRVFLAECISPFAAAYLCSFMQTKEKNGVKTVLTVLSAAAGVLTTPYRGTFLKYLLTFVLFGIIYISASAAGKKNSVAATSAAAAAANITAGVIYYAQLDNIAYNMAMLAVESAACFVIPFVIKSASSVICGEISLTEIKNDDIAGIYFLMAAVATGFCGIYIGNVSVGKSLCGLCIMIISFCGGCATASACGVGIGILNSLYAFEFNESAGVFGFCGLVSGALSRFKRPGVILGFVVSSKLLSLYFGGWSDSIFSDFEVIIAVCMFCLIPYSALMNVKTFLNINSYKTEELGRVLGNVSEKMKNISKSFGTLSDLSSRVFEKTPPNTADISTVYDMTADKICKTCGLKFICWDKEAFDTRDLLNKLTGILERKGYISSDDIPDKFRQKCIKSVAFVNELNRTFCGIKMNGRWQERLNHGQKLISMQLGGMAGIVDGLTSDIDKSIVFDKSKENLIYSRLEQRQISCSDITVTKNSDNITSVTMRIKQKNSSDFTQTCLAIEDTVSAVIGKNMGIESYSCKKTKYFIKLSEREQFTVTCSIKSLPKNGESVCGDNVVCGKISGGKYAVILSDGMGSGKNAAKISKTAIELLQQFLNAGFEKSNSVNMIGSAIMLGNSETFTTIDAVTVDLYTGQTEFIKAGANTSYVKTAKSVRKLSSTSLPVGIIDDVDIDTSSYCAKDGDIIVLISDGIQSAADDWFEQYLLNMHEDNPDIISALLLDEAVRNKKQDDDMTVAVIKITKNK